MKMLKENLLPTTEQMAALAQNEFQQNTSFAENNDVDIILDELLKIEYTLFQEKEKEILALIIEFADKNATSHKYPNIRALIDSIKQELANGVDAISLSKNFAPIWFAAIESNRQSKVTRAGHSLMHHLNFLFQINGFVLGSNYQKNYTVLTYPLDFFFPDLNNFKIDPLNCCAIACQTTINDKVKKVQSELPNNVRRRVCTAIGSPNFGKEAVKDLSASRLSEASNENYKFVVLESAFAINPNLKNEKSVMTYKSFFSDLNIVKNFWV
jgi:hypothetical protein